MRRQLLTSTLLIWAALGATACDSGSDPAEPADVEADLVGDEDLYDDAEDGGDEAGDETDGDAESFTTPAPQETPRPKMPVDELGRPNVRPTTAFGIVREMKRLYSLHRERPSERDLSRISDPVVRNELQDAQDKVLADWRAGLDEIVTYNDELAAAVGADEPDVEAAYVAGMARFLLADGVPKSEATANLEAAVVALQSFLDRAHAAHPLRPEVETRLAQAIALTSEAGEAREAASRSLLARMETLYDTAAERPPVRNLHEYDDAKARREAADLNAQEQGAWRTAVTGLYEATTDYVRHFNDGVDARVMFWLGSVQLELANLSDLERAKELRRAALDSLQTYLAAVGETEAEYRATAEFRLVDALLFSAADNPAYLGQAADLLPRVVPALLADGQPQRAMLVAHKVAKTLVEKARANGTSEELATVESLGQKLDIRNRDFGPGTEILRALFNAASVRVGAPVPELPDGTLLSGAPMRLADLRGKVVVLHFFKTDFSTRVKEVEEVLVPLYEAWKSKDALALVGVSIDWEMPADYRAKQVANFEEWGRSLDELHDGSKESVDDWARESGMTWPYHWDGLWAKSPVANLYGVPMNRPWAILIDTQGVIQWVGVPTKALSTAALRLLEDIK